MNILISIAIISLGTFFLLTPVRSSKLWKATVTPLASIIGSGFLVVAPLLAVHFGGYALVAMIAVNVFAFGIGDALRLLIQQEQGERGSTVVSWTNSERLISDVVLAASYVISVAFYVSILSSFVFRGLGYEHGDSEKILTTGVLLCIGVSGLSGGLRSLEALEKYAVSVKLSIIGGLLVSLCAFDLQGLFANSLPSISSSSDSWIERLRILGGILLIVQGFETSCYLGDEYDAATRIKTMRWAQLGGALIYIIFIATVMPIASSIESVSETAVIDISAQVSTLLPPLLVVAAVMSQFSAAVADTLGGGGLLSAYPASRLKARFAYCFIVAAAIVIIWSVDIFEIISLASRAFALYYGLQCLRAAIIARNRQDIGTGRVVVYSMLAAILFLCVVAAKPAG